MEVEVEKPLRVQRSNRRSNGDVIHPQVEKVKVKMRPTWQKEKSKASRELCLEKMRENITRQRKGNRTIEKISQTKEKTVMNGRLYCDVTELRNIIRQTAKERLQLERHLVRASELIRSSSAVDDSEFRLLKENNKNLRNQLQELQNADVRLGEKELELQRLRQELKSRQELCADLEHQLHATIEKHQEAERHSLDLEQQLQELQPVSEECHHLREALSAVENRYNSAKTEVDCLQGKVDNLEALVKHMREAGDRRKELERQHAEAVAELKHKQDELHHLHYTSKADKHHSLEVIQNLESKVRELQKKCDLQNVLHEELALEMAALRRSQSKQAWRTQRSHSADMPNEPSRLDEEMGLYPVGSDTLFSLNKSHTLSSSLPALDCGLSQNLNTPYEPLTSVSNTSPGMTRTTCISPRPCLNLGIPRTQGFSSFGGSTNFGAPKTPSSSPGGSTNFGKPKTPGVSPGGSTNLGISKTPGVFPGASTNFGRPKTPGVSPGVNVNFDMSQTPCVSPSLNVNVSMARTPGVSPGMNRCSSPISITVSRPSNTNTTSHEIDRIMARIEQDNRILAELERSRATVGSPVSSANLERLKAQFEEDQKQLGEIPYRSNMISSFSSTALDQLLVEPEKGREMFWKITRSKGPKTSPMMKELDVLMAKLEQDNKILAELDKKRATIGSLTTSSALYSGGRRPISATPPGSRSSTPLTGGSALQSSSGNYSSTLPSLPAGAPYGSANRSREDDIYNDIDYVDLPHRGRCKVFISRYSYDPLKQSPNENPEAELCLNAGDYVLIFGDMDEDGFFSGELMDGRKGLVPSNFIEKLTGEDLFEFQSQVLYGNRDSDDSSASFTYPDGEEEGHFMPGSSKVTIEDYHRMNDYIDLEDIEELDEDDLSDLEREEGPVPPPQRLILERQLNKSILIGWMPPDAPRGSVEAYHVYVDGIPKTTIRASEKTRALVEGVDSNQPHRISVRSVSPNGRHSRDAACTIVIGKDIPLAPSCVKASNITSTSAVISWLPSNSNFQHVVAINSVEVKTLKPGIFRHSISGLAPNTTYKVSVRARPARLFINHEKNPKKLGMLTATLEFRTHPKGWLPDPPVDVQIEPGPQDGTLLVTWLPVTINTKGTSNGAPVTGYVVYTGDRKIGEIDSPTGDHALLDMCQIAPLKRRTVTVRTKSGDYLSSESMPCIIPLELLKGVAATMMQSESTNTPIKTNEEREREKEKERPQRERKKSTGSSDSESDTELAELLKHVKCRSEAFDPSAENSTDGQQGSRVEDLVEEGLRSELSDIAEETEEDLMRNTDRGDRRGHQHMKDSRLSSRDHDRRTDRSGDRRRDDYLDDRYNDRRRGDRRDDMRLDRHDDMRIDRRDDMRMDRRDDGRMDRRDDVRRDDRRVDIIDDRHDSRRSYDRRDDRYYSQDRRQDIDSMRTTQHYSSPDHRPHDRSHGRMSPTGMHRDHSPRDRSYGGRPIVDGPIISNRRVVNNLGVERRNSAGQVIIEPEENLSDKEIYPQSQHVIPAIEITRDSEVTNPDDEYVRSGRRGYYTDSHRGQNNAQYYQGDRSRGRPVSPMPPSRHYRDQENSYYGHRGHSRHGRDDYYGDGYRRRSSPRGRVGPGADNRSRLFMALYDYDPQTMSPNPDAAEDELSFQEGQIIKIYGDKDPDGFYRGEIKGRFGFVPYNMVEEIQMDEEEANKHLMNENVSSRHHHGGDPSDPWSTLPVRKLVAMYDYDPQELSPNVDAEMELAFKTGDVIYVYGGVDEDGFYMGELCGVRGLVPSNFLTEAPADFRDPKVDRLGPPPRAGSSRYPKDHRDDSAYVRDSRNAPYPSSSAPKERMPLDKGHYTADRLTDDRSTYDRSRGHSSEADRGRYNTSSRSGQHW